MKHVLRLLIPLTLVLKGSFLPAYSPPEFPYAPAAGQPGSTALSHDDGRFQAWATSVHSIQYGEDVSEEWKKPEAALGPASANGEDAVVLGRSGSIVLQFEDLIGNGEGYDFAVFENAFSDTFLELAYVEVSTDGVHFVRFPNYSQTATPVPGFGHVNPTFIHGLAGKYRAGYGTPFDLSILEEAYFAALEGEGGFSETFREDLLSSFPRLDLAAVRYVRLVDISGDGSNRDCEGFPIYDPYPTFITAGFDLDAVGVINTGRIPTITFTEWSAGHRLEPVTDADTDRDKWPQYLEYLMGSDPTETQSVPWVEGTLDPQAEVYRIRYRVLKGATARPRVQCRTPGTEWTDLASQERGGAGPESSGQSHLLMEAAVPYRAGTEWLLVRMVP